MHLCYACGCTVIENKGYLLTTLKELATGYEKVRRSMFEDWLNTLSVDDRQFAHEVLTSGRYTVVSALRLFRKYGYTGTSREPLRTYISNSREEVK